jgi:3-oxoacyl-[acyl-carrier-protein] synthase-3
MNSKIIGTGSYLPEKVITNFELEKLVDTNDEWIRTRSGIEKRHIADEKEATSDLAAKAAIEALKAANLKASEIDLIIIGTLTPDKLMPSTASQVQRKINAQNATAFDIAAACSGFVYGITIADQFIKSGFYRNIVIIGAETLSRFINWNDRTTCVLFGDGAGAVVLSGNSDDNRGIIKTILGTNGFKPAEWLDIEAGGSYKPGGTYTNNNSEYFIRMNGREIFKFGSKILVSAILEILKKSHLSITDIDYIIPHQANMRITQHVASILKINEDKFIMNINECANTSAASIPIALDQAVKSGKINTGDRLILVGFGAGLTWGSALIDW